MTRIGFAYNQKPDPIAAPAAELARADEEPPSSGTAATLVAPAAAPDDEYAEWDAPETIAAVERALARHGDVIRLEATDDFPQRLRDTRPDIVFNIAEGLRGPIPKPMSPPSSRSNGSPNSGTTP